MVYCFRPTHLSILTSLNLINALFRCIVIFSLICILAFTITLNRWAFVFCYAHFSFDCIYLLGGWRFKNVHFTWDLSRWWLSSMLDHRLFYSVFVIVAVWAVSQFFYKKCYDWWLANVITFTALKNSTWRKNSIPTRQSLWTKYSLDECVNLTKWLIEC